MLTRDRLCRLPLVLRDAVQLRDGAYVLVLDGTELGLTSGAEPVRAFVDGWRPNLVLTLFRPLLLLEFQHRDGRHALWLLDLAGRFLGNDFAALPQPLLDDVRRQVVPALTWLGTMPSAALACMPPPPVLALAQLGTETLDAVAALVQDPAALPKQTIQAGIAAVLAAATPDRTPDHTAYTPFDIVLPMPLLPGWRVSRTVRDCAPVMIVELLHEDGREAVWYLDEALRYLGNAAAQLGGMPRRHLQLLCATLFQTLADRVLIAPALPAGPGLDWFLACARATRLDLLEFHIAAGPQQPQPAHAWMLTDPPPPALSYTVPTRTGRVVLEASHAQAACTNGLRDELFRLLRTGTMAWISPVDGRWFNAESRPLYIDNMCFAYQVHDPRYDLTYYAIASASFFRTFALYFPTANLVVAENRALYDEVRFYAPGAGELLLRHAATFGPTLLPALLNPPGQIVHAFRGRDAILLGHFVWQDLSGVAALVDAVAADRLPRFLVCETALAPEIYGPLDEIFPELDGKVDRSPSTFNDSIERFYRDRLTVIKATSMRVPAQVGTRIVAALRRAPRWASAIRAARAAHAAGPLLLVGLRVGNRTIDNQEGFVERLIDMLGAELGSLTVVLDGQNGIGPGQASSYASFGDTRGGDSLFLKQEAAMARRLARRFAGSSVRVVSLIGRPVQESVIWCSESDLFVAPWGAALAKYRWVCNRPGLATVGRWNLEHRNDLEIYRDPAAMDDPTTLLFNDLDAAEDVTEPVAGDPSRANYRLDETSVFAQVRGLLARHVPRRRRKPPLEPDRQLQEGSPLHRAAEPT